MTNLARDLARERSRDEQFVDDLLRGYLGECAQALAEGTVKIAPTTARNLLIDLSILWGLHDLQIIACRLFQDTMRPTGGWFEGTDMRPQTLDGLRKYAVKCGKHFPTIFNFFQRQGPGFTGPDKDPEFKKGMKSLIGFGTGNDVSEPIKFYAQMLGYSESDINDKDAPITEDERKFFRNVAREGISLTDTIVRKSEKTFQGRGGRQSPTPQSVYRQAHFVTA